MGSDFIIIGGGLAGLHTAWRLQQSGADWLLLEARDRLAGRIARPFNPNGVPIPIDLGPSWFWPHQTRLPALLDELGLDTFDQHSAGDVLYELDHHKPAVRQHGGMPVPSLRIQGGTSALTDRLVDQLDLARLRTAVPVDALARAAGKWQISTSASERVYQSDKLIAAIPPRQLARLLVDAPLSDALRTTFAAQQTWMSGQAKFVAVYPSDFWRADGLSGDVFSRLGPLAEIHDASDFNGEWPALFGFLGLDAAARSRIPAASLEAACIEQLGRLFGPKAQSPVQVFLMDWALERYTATVADLAEPSAHAAFPLERFGAELVDHRLALAGSEFARSEPGYLEGALQASTAALQQMRDSA